MATWASRGDSGTRRSVKGRGAPCGPPRGDARVHLRGGRSHPWRVAAHSAFRERLGHSPGTPLERPPPECSLPFGRPCGGPGPRCARSRRRLLRRRLLTVADKLEQTLDSRWDERRRLLQARRRRCRADGQLDALVDAFRRRDEGLDGPARNDERARALAARLVKPGGPYITKPALGQVHAPGWVNSMSGRGFQHLVFDAEVVDGLVYAYRARVALQLPESTVKGSATRSPHRAREVLALPDDPAQPGQLVLADVRRGRDRHGRPRLLKRDMSLQLRRFFAGARRRPRGSATSAPACASTTSRTGP